MESRDRRSVRILMAEDDDDDFFLATRALRQARLANEVMRVRDGEELMAYLLRRAPFESPDSSPVPHLVLLDLNMPRKSGREALAEIKSNPTLRSIPVVILSTSKAEEDILRSYDLGVNSYIRKPVDLPGLVEVMSVLGHYWFEIVELPRPE